jgi:DNA ligase 1
VRCRYALQLTSSAATGNFVLMSSWQIEFERGGIYLPGLRLWLDPHDPKTEPVFVSHAHSDHVDFHREVVLSAPTAKLMQARIGGRRIEHVLPWRERREFAGPAGPFAITLFPAGHIFGSAMSLIEVEDQSLLYTGDFKLRQGLSAEPCEPRHADTLIMETTYGRPEYRFPPTDAVMQGVIRFCKEALDNDEVPVLLGYSLGKSQELLCGLGDAGLPIMLHGTVFKMTQVYEQFGQCFPPYQPYEAGKVSGKVLLCPPSVVNSAMLRNLGKSRSAVLTGWAVDPNCKYRYRADAAFPLSDHADFPDLIEFVKRVAPKQVLTLHGFAADFACSLRQLGYDARALSENEQLTLGLPAELMAAPRSLHRTEHTVTFSSPSLSVLPSAPASFRRFAETCSAIGKLSSKLEKIRLLAAYLKSVDEANTPVVVTWFTGAAFASSDNKVLQLGWALLRDALCAVGQTDADRLHGIYLKHSDLGETAGEVFTGFDAASAGLTIAEVDQAFSALEVARGPRAKLPILVGLLQKCDALEAKFLVKIITTDLRIGLKEGLVEEAISAAFDVPADEVRQANLLLGNAGQTALLARMNRLGEASITPFRPVKFMLASPEPTASDIWARMHHETAPDASLWIEDKYDGIRCQLHKQDGKAALYSRDLKDITSTFHEIAAAARAIPADVILDGEVLAMRGDTVLSFAELQRRLGRREHDLFMGQEVPVKFVAFDILWRDGASVLKTPLRERRQLLESLGLPSSSFQLARVTPVASVDQIEAAFTAARGRNNEGLMVKDPESLYSPGRRGLAWVKLKKAYATLDCVVIGAEYGHGKRNKVLSDYTFAVRDDETGELKTIGKAYSGLTDLEIAALTSHFLERTVRQYGRFHEVVPDTVLEVAFDKLQPSDRHSSGLAMRFPRILRIRTDKTPAEIDTIASARRLVTR